VRPWTGLAGNSIVIAASRAATGLGRAAAMMLAARSVAVVRIRFGLPAGGGEDRFQWRNAMAGVVKSSPLSITTCPFRRVNRLVSLGCPDS
jgi:hypothetical protein